MIRLLTLLCVLIAAPAWAQDAAVPSPELSPEGKAKKAEETLAGPAPFEVVYGEADAKVTIVEYASLSCSHCKKFHDEVFKELKKEFVDTGKVRFIYRHFPLNLPALRGALLVGCLADDAKKGQLVSDLFDTQSKWAYATSEEAFNSKIFAVAEGAGFDKETFNACVTKKESEELILQHQLDASNYLDVRSTPTIFINGEQFTEGRSFDNISDAINALL